MPAKPPVNTKENNPMQGCSNQSKIDEFGLGPIVAKLREANLTHIDIADELNQKYLTGDIKTSSSAVWRWMRDNLKDKQDLRSSDYTVNVYRQECEMLDSINKQIDTLESSLDVLDKSTKANEDVVSLVKYTKDLMMTYDKLMARKQLLINSIGIAQEKIYSYMAVTEIITRIMDMVKQQDKTLYADIKNDIKSDPMLAECWRKIKPE